MALSNTGEQKAEGLAKFGLTTADLGVEANYFAGHVMWSESDGDIDSWDLTMFFSNFSRVWQSADKESLRVSFLVAGNGEDRTIIFNEATDPGRLVNGV